MNLGAPAQGDVRPLAPPFGGVIPLHLLLATSAKVLCSALFVSGRTESDAWCHSAFHALQTHHLGDALPSLVEGHVDRDTGRVRLDLRLDERAVGRIVEAYRAAYPDHVADWDGESERLRRLGRVSRQAQFTPSQGSVILREGDDRLRFDPVAVRTTLPDAEGEPWPRGDDLAGCAGSSKLDRAAVDAAVDAAFADARACTAAVVVVHCGELVGERYLDDLDRNRQLESWSMGKSVTATLVGILVQRGLLDLDDPVPVPAWQAPGDPRREITVRHLLQMRSGLDCPGYDEPRARWPLGLPDHFYVYGEAIDTFRFAWERPLELPVGSVGRYRNCDPLVLGWLIREAVRKRLGESYLAWPQETLFDAIGVRSQILETDLHGNFVMTGFNYGTARNWARLGLLYLDDGVAGGRRILPQGWSRFVGTPAPGWADRSYGGLFRVNANGDYPLPDDAYFMAGGAEQRVFVVPSADLVVVRLGHQAGYPFARRAVDDMLRRLTHAVQQQPRQPQRNIAP